MSANTITEKSTACPAIGSCRAELESGLEDFRERVAALAEQFKALGLKRASEIMNATATGTASTKRTSSKRSPVGNDRVLTMRGGEVKMIVQPWSGIWRIMVGRYCEGAGENVKQAMRKARRIKVQK